MLDRYLYLAILGLMPFIEPRYALVSIKLLGLNFYIGFAVLLLDIVILSFLPLLLKKFEELILRILGKNRFISTLYEKYLNHLRRKSKDLMEKYGLIGLFLYVLVPLPLTGMWSGAFISYLFDLDWRKSFIALFFGGLCSLLLVLFGLTII